MESPDAGRGVLAYARRKEYKPATAMVRKHRDGSAREDRKKPARACWWKPKTSPHC